MQILIMPYDPLNIIFRVITSLQSLTWTSAILWLMDTTNASLSYCIESRWIENRSRSIDMTVGGWLVYLSPVMRL